MIKLRGSASLGKNMFSAVNASWPLGSLSIDEEQLCISALLRSVTIRRDQIARICPHRVFFWREYRFHLKNAGKLPYISFGTWDLKKVLVALEEYGWQVDLGGKK